ncbi:MAG: GAF domain-containing protein [Lewinellaceae bacterium]|nr:GAF domain-containing protein [Lewinellaceae bacterium]
MMAGIQLRQLLNKRKQTARQLEQLIIELNVDVHIRDMQGEWVWGNPQADDAHNEAIIAGGETLGWLYGNGQTSLLSGLIGHLAEKESEKKLIGAEVLDLYREINLIYNFSEKLASALDARTIASTALDEVLQLIEADSAMVIFLPEGTEDPGILATAGEALFQEGDTIRQAEVLEFLNSGQANIRNQFKGPLGQSIIPVEALLYAPMKVKHRVLGMILLSHTLPFEYKASHLKLLTNIALQSASAIESALLFQKRIQEAQEREEAIRKIHEVTTRFVPYEFISALGRENLTEVVLGDQIEREVTVFFSDIRDYTTLSESMTPEENFRFVNAFNRRVGPRIYHNNGFINQYLGDGIMAIFPGTPAEALAASVEIQQNVRQYNIERAEAGRKPIAIGIGLHTGPLIMGITGDHQRMEATTIADTVNTASRIESLTKYFGAKILLSGESLNKIKAVPNSPDFGLRYLGQVQVKGKYEPVAIFECFDGDSDKQVKWKSETQSLFAEAMDNYLIQDFNTSRRLLQELLSKNPHDLPAQLLLKRIHNHQQNGLPEDWSGVEIMQSK